MHYHHIDRAYLRFIWRNNCFPNEKIFESSDWNSSCENSDDSYNNMNQQVSYDNFTNDEIY